MFSRFGLVVSSAVLFLATGAVIADETTHQKMACGDDKSYHLSE